MEDNQTGTRTFTVDLRQLSKKPHSATSSVFSRLDAHYLNTFGDRKDMLRQYRDIPMALGSLYKGSEHSDYIKNRHGNDLMVTIENPSHAALAHQQQAAVQGVNIRSRRRR